MIFLAEGNLLPQLHSTLSIGHSAFDEEVIFNFEFCPAFAIYAAILVITIAV